MIQHDFIAQTENILKRLRRATVGHVYFFSRAHAYGASTVILMLSLGLMSLSFAAEKESALDQTAKSLSGADLKTKYAALQSLESNRTQEAAELLARTAVRESDDNFRLTVLDQLAARGYAQVVPNLKPLLQDKTTVVRQRTARVIGMLGGPVAEKLLMNALALENDANVKSALLQGLGLCGSAQSVPAIKAALSDTHAHVRANGVAALDRIPGDAAKDALKNAENDSDKNVRKLAQDSHRKRTKSK